MAHYRPGALTGQVSNKYYRWHKHRRIKTEARSLYVEIGGWVTHRHAGNWNFIYGDVVAVRRMITEVSAAALSMLLLIFVIGCCHRRRRQKTPPTRVANMTTTDCTNMPPLGSRRADCWCGHIAQCTCTIIVYRPTPNNHRQTTTSQHGSCIHRRRSDHDAHLTATDNELLNN